MVWNDFAVRTAEETTSRVLSRLAEVESACAAQSGTVLARHKHLLERLGKITAVDAERRGHHGTPLWHLEMININLADAIIRNPQHMVDSVSVVTSCFPECG